jgi:hypothetical protein
MWKYQQNALIVYVALQSLHCDMFRLDFAIFRENTPSLEPFAVKAILSVKFTQINELSMQ